MTLTGTALNDFDDSIFTFVEGHEGLKAQVYVDQNGIPTIGVGTALGTGAASDGTLSIPSLTTLNDLFSGIHTFTSGERDYLVDLTDRLNSGAITVAAATTELKDTANQAGGDLAGLSINESQAHSLYDTRMADNIAATASALTTNYSEPTIGYDPGADFTTLQSDLAGTKELVAIDDMAYHGPTWVGPKLVEDILGNDRAAAWFEIRYDHSETGDAGLQHRQASDADMFGLVGAGGTAADVANAIVELETTTFSGTTTMYQDIKAHDSNDPLEQTLPWKTLQAVYSGGHEIDYVQTGSGTIDTVAAYGKDTSTTNNLYIADSGTVAFHVTGANAYVYGGSGTETVYMGAGGGTLSTGTGAATYIFDPSEPSTVRVVAHPGAGATTIEFDTTHMSISESDITFSMRFDANGTPELYMMAGSTTIEQNIADLSGGGGIHYVQIGSGGTPIALSDLTNYPSDLISPPDSGKVLNDLLNNAQSDMGSVIQATDPLVIDVSTGHTGIALTTFDASTTTTFFDMQSSGFAQQTAWTSGDTGFLVQDTNNNGKIDNATEMFGSNGADGFAQLAALDSNHDLKIDSHDTIWGTLQVWIDANGDGITDSGELHSLSSLGIASIDLAGVAPPTSETSIDGNEVSHVSTITFTDSSTADIADVWLATSPANSYYAGDYTLNADTLAMPDLRGYGSLPDLTIAMSQDSTLKGMVSDYVTAFQSDGFAMSTLDSDFASILYRWAGVDGVDSSSRGPNIDARQLEFVEHLLGEGFYQVHNPTDTNPMALPAEYIETIWQNVSTNFMDEVILQAGGNTLFTNPVTYNPWTGSTTGDTALSHDGIDALAAAAPTDSAANLAYWLEVGHFVDTIKGLGNVTTTEDGWLNDAVSSTNAGLDWDDVSATIGGTVTPNSISSSTNYDSVTGTDAADAITVSGLDTTVHGGAGNDVITGYSGHDVLYGDAGNDTIYSGSDGNTLYGGDGNDLLYGGSGADTLDGGAGGNMLYGAGGDDIYVHSGGDDYIDENDAGGTDQIVMPSGVTASDLSFARVETGSSDSYNDLLITIKGGGTIQIHNQLDAVNTGYHVESIVFSDSSTLDLSTVNPSDAYLADGGASFSWSSSSAISVHGGSGDDTIYTYYSSADNTVDGGAGNDAINLGSGNDTVIASPGYDTISNTGGTDTIVIPAAYTMDDITFLHPAGSNYHLIIDIAGLGEMDISTQFYSSDGITNLHFLADDSTVSIADQTVNVIGTAGNDYLYGPTAGIAGSTFDGRGGDDYFTGGTGDNTFVFGPGFGNNTVTESSTGGTNTIHFTGIDPSDIRMWTDSYGALHLQDVTDTSHSITVSAGTTGSGYSESAIGTYLSQITFDDTGSTVWTVADGLHITGDNSGDSLYGTPYADTITAGTGTNYLYGNGGSDTYVFASGFGNNTIYEQSNTDTNTIHFTGVDPSDIRMWTDTGGALHLQDITDTSHSITVYAATTGAGGTTDESAIGQYIQQISFDDTGHTTWDLTSGITLTADNSGDSLYGTAGADTIIGGTGSDFLYGNGGNNTLISGGGADYLYGGTGNNTFVFGSGFGSSTVYATADAGSNTIHFTGIDPGNIRMWTDTSGNLHLQDTTDTSHNITIGAGTTGATGTAYESTIDHYVQHITFDDGGSTTWDLTSGLHITGDNSGDSLYGAAHADTITGGTGADYIWGNSGNDVIYGGGGADYLTGGAGADTFVFHGDTALAASATIADFSTSDGDKIDISNILEAYDPVTMAIADFVQATTSGSNTLLSVDTDGAGTSHSMVQIATIQGVTGLDINDLITNGNLIVHT